jgi:hydrogenase-4 component F
MYEKTLIWLLLTPLILSIIIFATRWLRPFSRRLFSHLTVEVFHLLSVLLVLVLSLVVVQGVLANGNIFALNNWLHVDALAALFLLIISIVGFLVGLYSLGYIRHELDTGEFDENKLCNYYGLFSLFLFTMLMVVTANNIIMMWVAVEATTLGSTFLVGIYGHRSSLEAAWKYVMICTVGVAFGLYGTILVYSDAYNVLQRPEMATLWTEIVKNARLLDPTILKMAFVFILIGFGTKAGIFPMHAWLPDAHSEAPSPVSALLSAVLLNCALFVIIRYNTIISQGIGPGFSQTLFLIFGILSIGASAFFMFVQRDIKRLLAYSSVENIGLILLALGIGGNLGMLAGLLHAINHSLVKSLLFCASGNILIKYHTRNLDLIRGMLHIAPVTSFLLMGGAMALVGLPPFNIFVSKFFIISAGIGYGHIGLMIFVLLLLLVVFATIFRLLGSSVLGEVPAGLVRGDVSLLTQAPILLFLILAIVLGLYLPPQISTLLNGAANIALVGQPQAQAAGALLGQNSPGLPAGLLQISSFLAQLQAFK